MVDLNYRIFSIKGFLNSLSNSLSKELGKNQIRSNVISLGKFETDNFMKNYNGKKRVWYQIYHLAILVNQSMFQR